ncbi:MAG: molybdopterin-containing oxidoreductase family protein [Desulfurivibrio sp.]
MANKNRCSRRSFLKTAGLAAAALPLAALMARAEAPGPAFPAGGQRQVGTVCGICPARCLITATVREGRVVHLAGTDGNPLNGSQICARGQAALDLLYDPDRLKYPMKRVGPRGSGDWQRISWAEAIDTIALKMEETLRHSGPGALALFAAGSSSRYIRELFAEFAVPHLNDSHYEHCHCNREAAYISTLGFSPGAPPRLDYRNTRCLVLLGCHQGENLMLPEFGRLFAALDRGARLIVADPRRSVIAGRADHHLMLRPGSDIALLLGWCNFLLERGLYDREFVAARVEGLEELRELAAAYPLARVAELTGLSEESIEKSALLLAASAPAVIIHPGRHSNWYGDDVHRLRAQAILSALLGAVGRPGGLLLPVVEPGPHDSPSLYARGRESLTRALQPRGGDRSAVIIEGLEQERIRFLGCWGQNPFHGYPNPYRTALAWQKADFIFTCDLLPSEAALHADIILPEATFLERHGRVEFRDEVEPPLLTAGFPALAPAFETRDPYWIVRELSIRTGRGRGFRLPEVTTRLEQELVNLPIGLEDLRRGGAWRPLAEPVTPELMGFRFPTVSGKIELVSRDLIAAGQPALPEFTPPPSVPQGYFRLLYGRSPLHTNSSTQNNRRLMGEKSENELWLNSGAAAELGVVQGERVLLANQDGLSSLKPVRLNVTDAIRSDCVYLVHGFGNRSPLLQQAYDQGVSDAALMTRITLNPVTGMRAMRNNFVRLIPLSATPATRDPDA